jgi:RHS repeat-associated protein
MWAEGMVDGVYYRQSLKVSSWEKAEQIRREMEEGKTVKPVTVSEATEAFLAEQKARALADSSLRKLKSLTTSLGDFCRVSHRAGVNNNGNVQGQTITRSGQQWTQSFLCDGVDRLTCANEVTGLTNLPCGTGAPGWYEMYGYDTAGNRAVTSSSFPEDFSTPTNINQYSSLTNRIALQYNGQAMPSDAYDASGNLHDHPFMGTFSYDAENRMTSATIAGISTSYAYDGEGRRVAKTTGAGTTYYVYDAMGELAAEYPAAAATSAGTQYLTVDALGSTRLVTSAGGTVVESEDYLPFGEQLMAGTDGRSDATFSVDVVPEKFTGKERDAESGLDYFGARYFSSSQGRFTSPDPLLSSGAAALPQTWNRYSYGLNNPLRFIDPTGLLWTSSGDSANPYRWVDNCGDDQVCYNAVAANVGGNLRVYGSAGDFDVFDVQSRSVDYATTHGDYSADLVDASFLFNNPDAHFRDHQDIKENYLQVDVAAALFNAGQYYHSLYPQDQPIGYNGGSASDGLPALKPDGTRAHKEHYGGVEVDLTYMGSDGRYTTSGSADVHRMANLYLGLLGSGSPISNSYSATPGRFGFPSVFIDGHGAHIHFGPKNVRKYQ